MIEHLEIPSTIVHINSTEGKKQIQEEMEKSKVFLFVHASKLFIYKTITNVFSCMSHVT